MGLNNVREAPYQHTHRHTAKTKVYQEEPTARQRQHEEM